MKNSNKSIWDYLKHANQQVVAAQKKHLSRKSTRLADKICLPITIASFLLITLFDSEGIKLFFAGIFFISILLYPVLLIIFRKYIDK